ncbi:hypothetical protein BDN67DRAFT_1014962 [Paxillus ammoniavirescens]|nr:hypothetical protein BDN67DRAFT_1014962 [Paxillus ammoniavirescens]
MLVPKPYHSIAFILVLITSSSPHTGSNASTYVAPSSGKKNVTQKGLGTPVGSIASDVCTNFVADVVKQRGAPVDVKRRLV